MGRKPLRPDEKVRRTKERQAKYYDKNRERLLHKARNTYDPEKKQAYYNAHFDEIKETQRMSNIKRSHTENYIQIKEMIPEDCELSLKAAIDKYINCGVRLMKDDATTLLRLFEAIKAY